MRGKIRILGLVAMALSVALVPTQSDAQSKPPPSPEALAAQIEALKQDYEARLRALESQLSTLKARSARAEAKPATPASRAKPAGDNAFNPAIGIVFDGRYGNYSADESAIPGFPGGHESERAPEGLSLGHSEVTASGNIDDKFRGALTLGLGAHPGEATEVELEEAYVQTLAGTGLPGGMRLKAGRALWTFGYLNELHAHGDDFVDRPLPYRAFLDNAYNDDGVEFSVVLPTEFYSEVGAGLFRGDDMPFGGSDNGMRAKSLYTRIGWDMGRDAAVRIGGYVLDGKSEGRTGVAHEHEHEEEHEEEHAEENGDEEHHHDHAEFFSEGAFTGDTRLYAVDFRFAMAPTGNARESELILQGEYFWRKEKGTYALTEEELEIEEEDGAQVVHLHEHTESEELDGTAHGWYLQGVYKATPQWRIGARYSRLTLPDDADIKHDPYAFALMTDWTNSEFGRIRLQYNREVLDPDEPDTQIILQYVMSLGAHAAHSF